MQTQNKSKAENHRHNYR